MSNIQHSTASNLQHPPRLDGAMLFEEKKIIERRAAPNFSDLPFVARSTREGNIELSQQGEPRSWIEMQQERSLAKARNLTSLNITTALESAQGFAPTNVGISLLVHVPYQGRNFILTVLQERPDFGDVVAKNPSGYVNWSARPPGQSLIETLRRAALTEATEEIVVWDHDSPALLKAVLSPSGAGGALVARANDALLAEHRLDGTCALRPAYATLIPYSSLGAWELELSGSPLRMSAVSPAASVIIDGERMEHANLYFSQAFGSAQILQNCRLRLPSSPSPSLSHIEQLPPGDDGMLPLQYQRDGALLLEINEGVLTGESFFLRRGVLEKALQPEQITLSEAFVPSTLRKNGSPTGIVAQRNISLLDYLRAQRSHADRLD